MNRLIHIDFEVPGFGEFEQGPQTVSGGGGAGA